MLHLPLAILALGSVAACRQNAAQSADHSAVAASHCSAAIGGSVSTVVAVPLMASGASLLVSGAAIQSSTQTSPPPAAPLHTPNGPPAL
ncbi:MAG: hypothetical protein P8P56_00525 [Yoonia sp.]|nr:hypothetical protein [Yoonia sp.]